MKISIVVAILILVIAAGLSWQDRQRLQDLAETQRALVAEASALGLSVDFDDPDAVVLATKHARENEEAEGQLMAKDFIAYTLEMEALQERGSQPDEDSQERFLDISERMMALSPRQLKIVIEELQNNTEMKDETRWGMMGFAIMTLADASPKAALALLMESEDLRENQTQYTRYISGSLTKWASSDLEGALEWVRENGKKYPDLVGDSLKSRLISGVGSKDIAMGFRLLDELKIEKPHDAIKSFARSAKTTEERTEFLVAYRDFLKTLPEDSEEKSSSVFQSLGYGIVRDGFEDATSWIAENELSEAEIEIVMQSVTSNTESPETALWIDWMGQNLPEKTRDGQIEATMWSWTRADYRAAGEWLASAPEGPAKQASVVGYAKAVARFEPQTAAQWALTLPPGRQRKETLQSVYKNWPQNDAVSKAEREAFMAEHPVE